MGRNWGQAHIEFKGLQEEICNELESVQSVKSIFNKLRAAGRISVTYKAFCEHVKSYRESLKEPCSSSWGSARTEVIGQMGQIRAALADGRPLKSIYDQLKAEHRVSCSYRGGFHKNVKKFCVQAEFPRSLAVQQSPPPPPESNSAPPRAVSPAPPSPAPLPRAVSTDAVAVIPEAESAPQRAADKGFAEKVSARRRDSRVPVFDRTPLTKEEIYGCPKSK